jgi:hypothetical protein
MKLKAIAVLGIILVPADAGDAQMTRTELPAQSTRIVQADACRNRSCSLENKLRVSRMNANLILRGGGVIFRRYDCPVCHPAAQSATDSCNLQPSGQRKFAMKGEFKRAVASRDKVS